MDNASLKDHRQIGQELDLFSFHDVSPGAVFWHDKGLTVYKTIAEFLRALLSGGYQEIATPIMVKTKLFEQSGHWEHYKENMFTVTVENEQYALKPMNC